MTQSSNLTASLPMIAAVRALVAQLPDPALRARIEDALDGKPDAAGEVRPEVLSGDDAATILGCKRRCVQKLASEGRIRVLQLPGRKLGCGYLRADIEALLVGTRRTPKPKAAQAEAEVRTAG